MHNQLLFIPQKADSERAQVAQAWQQQGGTVQALGKFWRKPPTHGKQVSIYGPDTFALVLAQVLGVQLLSPKEEDLALIEEAFIKRTITLVAVEKVQQLTFPLFIKPTIPKLFPAQVFDSLEQLKPQLQHLAPASWLLCSTVITVEKEVRAFILEGQILDLAYYEGQGELETAAAFIQYFLKNTSINLPTSFVLDVGWNAQQGWLVVEMNASWGAGLNGCNAAKVLEGIQRATLLGDLP